MNILFQHCQLFGNFIKLRCNTHLLLNQQVQNSASKLNPKFCPCNQLPPQGPPLIHHSLGGSRRGSDQGTPADLWQSSVKSRLYFKKTPIPCTISPSLESHLNTLLVNKFSYILVRGVKPASKSSFCDSTKPLSAS